VKSEDVLKDESPKGREEILTLEWLLSTTLLLCVPISKQKPDFLNLFLYI